jgi:hypothetical protein
MKIAQFSTFAGAVADLPGFLYVVEAFQGYRRAG